MSARPSPDQLAQLLTHALEQPVIDVEQLAERVAERVVERLNNAPLGWRVPQLAARIGHTPSFVYREIRAGRLRAKRIGGDGEMVITPDDAAAWMSGKR